MCILPVSDIVFSALFLFEGFSLENLITFLILSSSVFFSISEPLLRLENGEGRKLIFKLHFLQGFQSLLMLSISLFFSRIDNKIWFIATFCIVGGFILGTFLLILYLKSYKPVQVVPDVNDQVIRETEEVGQSNNGQEAQGNM